MPSRVYRAGDYFWRVYLTDSAVVDEIDADDLMLDEGVLSFYKDGFVVVAYAPGTWHHVLKVDIVEKSEQ